MIEASRQPAALASGAGLGPYALVKMLLMAWRLLDGLLPKRRDHWAFFTHPLKPTQLVENARAVFEQVARDPAITKLIFVRGACEDLQLDDPVNTRVLQLGSVPGLMALARCGVLLLTNSVAMDLSLRWPDGRFCSPRPLLRRRAVVNLWHGIPLKGLFALANPRQRKHGDRIAWRRRERSDYTGLVCSSDTDRYAMTAIFHPIPPQNVWATGLPRNDFLKLAESTLPRTLRQQLVRLRAQTAGRRLVLYAPTYRDAAVSQHACYCFSDTEVDRLKALLKRHDTVLGLRTHYLRNGHDPFYPSHFDDTLVDVGHEQHPEIAPLLREAALVMTDYSSVYIDALYLDLPVLAFAYDLSQYRAEQNGLLYDLELAFPGPVTTNFEALLQALEQQLGSAEFVPDLRYRSAQRLFFNHRDTGNAARLVARLKDALDPGTAPA